MTESARSRGREGNRGNGRIGQYNESTLHAALKEWCARPGDVLETEVDGYCIDIMRPDLLIEIQTGHFASIRDKLQDLLGRHQVRLVYPVPQTKWIVRVSPEDGHVISRRRSPKKGTPLHLFDEMVYIPDLLCEAGFSLVILLTEQEEIRCDDGRGSWRRKGVSILDHRLLSVQERLLMKGPQDLLPLLPDDLEHPFTSKGLASAGHIRRRLAGRVIYCLRKTGLVTQVGMQGRASVYDLTAADASS